MCAIIGSYDKNKVIELCELNAYRGQSSHSITYLNTDGNHWQKSSPGQINYDDLLETDDVDIYIVVHLQAPTGEFHDKYIHPSDVNDDLLWHNGIVKQNEIKRLNEQYGTQFEWDTDLINNLVHQYGPSVLSEIDGSFACLWSHGSHFYAFRNEIAPLFVDDHMNISSTKFDNSRSIEPNVFFNIDLEKRVLTVEEKFKTKNNPYYYG